MGLDTFPSNNFHWKLGPHMLFIKSWVQIFHNLHLYKMTEIIVSVWASVHRGMCVCVQVLFLKRRHMSPKHQLRHKRGKVQKNRALSAFRCIFSLQLFCIQNYSVAFLVFFHFAQQQKITIWQLRGLRQKEFMDWWRGVVITMTMMMIIIIIKVVIIMMMMTIVWLDW